MSYRGGCISRLWQALCLCGWLGGYANIDDDDNEDAAKGRDLEIRLWPDYDDGYAYMDDNGLLVGRYSIYLCGCMPAGIARAISSVCCGCACFWWRLDGDRGLGWIISSRVGRTRLFAWITILTLILLGGMLWRRTGHLREIEESPCYVCRYPPAFTDADRGEHGWLQRFLGVSPLPNTGPKSINTMTATRALARYAVYVHGPQCALDDSYVDALDQVAMKQWWADWYRDVVPGSLHHKDTLDAWTLWDRYVSGGPESVSAVTDDPPHSDESSATAGGIPRLFVIGCKGAGATSLMHYLSAHPQLWLPAGSDGGPAGRQDHFFATITDWKPPELKVWVKESWPPSGVPAAPSNGGDVVTTDAVSKEEDMHSAGQKRGKHRKRGGRRNRKHKEPIKVGPVAPPAPTTSDPRVTHARQRAEAARRRDRRVRRARRALGLRRTDKDNSGGRSRRKRAWGREERLRIEVGSDYYWAVGLGAAAAVRRAQPDAKMVVLLSDPVRLVSEAHARAVEAGLETRALHEAVADELPALIRCLLWDAAGAEEQRERLLSGACGGLQPIVGPPYVWRAMVSEYLEAWMRILPGRERYYFVRSADLLMQPNRTLNRLVTTFMGADEFDFGPHVQRVYKPRGTELRKMAGAGWASVRSTVSRLDYIAELRKTASDALLATAVSTVERTVPGARTAASLLQTARLLHCKIAKTMAENTRGLMVYNCDRDAVNKEPPPKRRHKGRKHAVKDIDDGDSATGNDDIAAQEVMAMLRRFLEPYQTRLIQLAADRIDN